jgi:hypothetical protein
MSTNNAHKPFAPPAPLSREQWDRYLRGDLPLAERHAVELQLESDPLLREAMEGAAMPGALEAMEQLRTQRPGGGGSAVKYWIAGSVGALSVVALLWWTGGSKEEPPVAVVPPPAEAPSTPVTVEDRQAFAQEVIDAKPVPADAQVGHGVPERFIAEVPSPSVERIASPDKLEPVPTAVEPKPEPMPAPVEVKADRHGRQLLFLYDLKLVAPSEMYANDPLLMLDQRAVDASHADAQARDAARKATVALPYADFMDEAMRKYAKGDRQGCIEDLFFLLRQHPDDVNALFYAGLSAYELGLNDRAINYLDRAQHHAIDIFEEEAQWYHALAVDRGRGRAEALPLIRQVAERKGFYAPRAAALLKGR